MFIDFKLISLFFLAYSYALIPLIFLAEKIGGIWVLVFSNALNALSNAFLVIDILLFNFETSLPSS